MVSANRQTVTDYYNREAKISPDGGPLFSTDHDKQNEDQVSKIVEQKWNCEVHPFGQMCPVDFWAERNGRIVGVLELKSRTHSKAKYGDVFLNVRKWLSLSLAAAGLGCPAIFVVKFTDAVYWVPLSEIKAPFKIKVDGGCKERVKSHTDVEPVILVPIADMKPL